MPVGGVSSASLGTLSMRVRGQSWIYLIPVLDSVGEDRNRDFLAYLKIHRLILILTGNHGHELAPTLRHQDRPRLAHERMPQGDSSALKGRGRSRALVWSLDILGPTQSAGTLTNAWAKS